MCLIGKAIIPETCYGCVPVGTGRGLFCRDKGDQEKARQVWKKPTLPPTCVRVSVWSVPMFWFEPVGAGPPCGRLLSTTRFSSASPGYAGIIPGWRPRMANPKSSNLSTACYGPFANWDIKGRLRSTMRVIRGVRRNPPVPQNEGRGTNFRNSPGRPNATPQNSIELDRLGDQHFKSFPTSRGFALNGRAGWEKTL